MLNYDKLAQPTRPAFNAVRVLWATFCMMWFSVSASIIVRRWNACSTALSNSTRRHMASTEAFVIGFCRDTWRFIVVVTSWRIEYAYSRPCINQSVSDSLRELNNGNISLSALTTSHRMRSGYDNWKVCFQSKNEKFAEIVLRWCPSRQFQSTEYSQKTSGKQENAL